MALQHLQHNTQKAHLDIQLPVFLVQLLQSHQQHALDSTGAHAAAAARLVSAAVSHNRALVCLSLHRKA